MKNIRHSVFETNSSSTHSVSIASDSDGILESLYPNEKGILLLKGGEFGWEWEKYNDAETKANYCAVFAKDSEELTELLHNVIKEHTGAKEVKFLDEGNIGYIDHQSNFGEGGDALKVFDSPETLKNFIFNPRSWLFTGNDNDMDPPNFYDVDENIKYVSQLEIEGMSLVYKFTSKPTEDELQKQIENLISNHPMCDYSSSTKERYKVFFKDSYYNNKNISGQIMDSFESIDKGIIKLFLTEEIFTEDSYKEKLIKVKELKFKISPPSN